MTEFLRWSGLVLFVISFAKLAEAWYANRRVVQLADVVPAEAQLGPRPPRLSLVVPACNEVAAVEGAVRSMLAQDYPDLELVLVNDRSTDGTGEVMDRLAAEYRAAGRQVQVIHIDRLPEGWLGKNHALYVGASRATGEWLLFADADVHFHPTTFRRAMAFVLERQLDHLTLAPQLNSHGFWLRSWVAFFIMAFVAYKTPYKANDPKSKVGMGIGAFNLIRRNVYEAIGTHRAISLRPDDDLRLGQRVKRMGFRQFVLLGNGLAEVEWYPTLWEGVRGLEKNTFAGLEYNLFLALGSVLGVLGIMVWPFAVIWFARGLAFWLYLGAILAQLVIYWLGNAALGWRVIPLMLGYPGAALIFAFTIARSMWLTLRQGGVHWRGTFYPLRLLKSQSGLD